MLFIESIDGHSYIVSRDSISMIRSHGDKVILFIKNSDEKIIVKSCIDELAKSLEIVNFENKINGRYKL